MSQSSRKMHTPGKQPPKGKGNVSPPRAVEEEVEGDFDLHAETSHDMSSPYRDETDDGAGFRGEVLAEFQEQVDATYAAGRSLEAAAAIETDVEPVDAWYGSYGTRLSRVMASRGDGYSIEEMVAEVIIGPDDRRRVHDTLRYPYGCICQLEIRSRNGGRFVGTGWLADEQTVVTAGHCLYMHREGGWAASIEVFPGRDGPSTPYRARATRVWATRGWTERRSPPADYGAIRLDRKIDTLGTFGYGALEAGELRSLVCHVVGYPADKRGEMWGHGRRLSAVHPEILVYDIDTYGGNSGGPVFLVRNGNPLAVGIHNYGDYSGNSATRITRTVYQRIQGWVAA